MNNLIFIVIVIIVIAFGEAFRCVGNSIGFQNQKLWASRTAFKNKNESIV